MTKEQLENENKELKERLGGYERTMERFRKMGFPTFCSCREYAANGELLYRRTELGECMNVATEWHDLRKDPKDLPTPSGEMPAERIPVLACTKELGVTVAIRRRHGRAYEWYCSTYDGNTVFLDREIIAWCEIPKF